MDRIDDFYLDGVVVMGSEPLQDVAIEEIRERISVMETTQQLVEIYANVHNKFWFIEDEVYDYDAGTKGYKETVERVTQWKNLWLELEEQIINQAKSQGLFRERQENSELMKQLELFMAQYGYKDGCGWWVLDKKCKC